jgi:HK97 family phage portal protein
MPIVGYPGWVDALRNGEELTDTIDGYNTVPMLYRAVNLRCDALSSVPYRINRGDTEIEWPWTQSFVQLIKETERSLLLTGSAFWLKLRKGRVLTGFQFLNPKSVTVKFDPQFAEPGNPFAGVTFTQQFRGVTFGPWTMEDIVYFREPSMNDDIGPGLAPARVALQSAQLAHYLERFASHFFEGGAQPVTIMNLPESMDESEFQRFKGEWGRFSGVVNAFRTAFVRSSEIKATVITPPIKDLMLPELQERVITTIAMTLGVPRTMLEASAANYATADSDRQSFWRETIVPRLGIYEHIINTQLFDALGYNLEFHADELDVLQADEAQRAGSLKLLVDAGMPLRGAMQTLGYKNIDDTLAMTGPETQTPTDAGLPLDIGDNVEPTAAPIVAPSESVATPGSVANNKSIEWSLLSKKIERRIKSGRDPRTSFDSAYVTAGEVNAVMERCYKGMTVAHMHAIVDAIKAPVDDMTPDELRIYNKIIKDMRAKGEQWAKDIYNSNDPETSLREVIKPVLDTELGVTMGKRLDSFGTQFSIPMDTNDEQRYIQDWLTDYTPKTTAKIDQTTADRIKPIIETFRTTPGMTIQDIQAAVLPLSDPMRAKMIAITETTRAAAQATVSYKDYLGERGIQMQRVWNTDADERVCSICSGEIYNVNLDGSTEDEWPAELADGPPAHVNCRCDTSLRLVK